MAKKKSNKFNEFLSKCWSGIKAFFTHWFVLNFMLAMLILVILVTGAWFGLKLVTAHNKEVAVPDFTNLTISQAKALAKKSDVVVEIVDSVYVKRMKSGATYRQYPKAGTKVKKGRRVSLTINAVNPRFISMPNLVGYSMRQAKAELLSRGLVLGQLKYVDDIATNNVLRQFYRGKEIAPGVKLASESVIDLEVGLNEMDRTTYVPDLIGVKRLNAIDAIHESSLNVGKIVYKNVGGEFADTLNSVVYRQTPSDLSLPLKMGSHVSIYLTNDMSLVPEKPENEQ